MIMITFVDNTVEQGLLLLRSLDRHVFTVAGGISVIMCPERFHKYPEIDMIYDGMAEDLILNDGDTVPFEDYTIFDKDRMVRPFSGKQKI